MISTSQRFSLDKVDLYKSLRTGAVTFATIYATGVFNALPTLLGTQGMQDPQTLLKALAIAGATAVIEAIRRWLTDHSSN